MRDVEYNICETQQDIFEYMAQKGYDMKVFSDAYLSSDFCRRAMDTNYSRFLLEDTEECADFFMPEIGHMLTKVSDNKMFNLDVAAWIGFTYRQLYIETGTPSAELIKIIPFERMCACYAGLHTIDEEVAAERLIENHSDVLKKRQCNLGIT